MASANAERMTREEEEAFWRGLDVAMREELELGPPPPTIQLEKVGWWVLWGLAVEPAQEGPPLLPLGPRPMEVDGAEQVPEDGTPVKDAADEEASSLPS